MRRYGDAMPVRKTVKQLVRAATTPIDPTDPDGLDPELITALARPVQKLCRVWFGLEVEGIEHLPEGPALLVGNHNSGSSFVEAMGVAAESHLQRPDLPWHGLAHDAIIGLPALGRVLHRLGALKAGHETAAGAFARGRKVIVFPGGNREAYRPFRRRYRVEMGDRRGFVKLALRHRVPIVPVVFVGGHSGFIVLDDGKRLARLLRAERWLRSDTWPLWVGLPFGVFLGPGMHVPLPVKCTTRFLPPIDPLDHGDPEDPATVEKVFTAVETAMQLAMDELAAARRRRPWPLRR
jgi:1-acyl-sn-glycerol-3-phosphate acyltransferase